MTPDWVAGLLIPINVSALALAFDDEVPVGPDLSAKWVRPSPGRRNPQPTDSETAAMGRRFRLMSERL